MKKEGLLNNSDRWIPWLCFGLLAIGLLGFNHVLEIRAAEGRRALVTFEMLYGAGDWLTPYLHGYPYYNKPPFYNWVLAVFFTGFGSIREWVLRLPGVLSILATAWVVFKVARSYIGRDAAMLSAASFLTITDLLFYGSVNTGEIDLFYALLTFGQMLAIFHFSRSERWFLLYAISYTLMGIGFLTKGLPSIAFQGLTLVVYLAAIGKFKRLFTWQHLTGGLIAIVIGGGYFLLYDQNGDAMGYLMMTVKQASQRSANEYPVSKVIESLVVFPFDILRRLLPWSLGILFLFSKGVRRSLWNDVLMRFLLIFTAANILVYWTAPNMAIRYMYMFFPVFALLLTYMIVVGRDRLPKLTIGIEWLITSLLGLGGLGCFAVPVFIEFDVGETLVLGLSGVVLLGCTWWAYRSRGLLRFYWILALSLAVMRMTYNLVGLPYTDRVLPDYEGMTLEMIEVAGDRPIHFYDDPMMVWPQLSILGDTLYQTPLKIPDDYTAGFPYYYAIHTGKVMDLQRNSEEGHCYLMFDFRMQPEHKELLRFPNMIGGRTMVFCEVRDESASGSEE